MAVVLNDRAAPAGLGAVRRWRPGGRTRRGVLVGHRVRTTPARHLRDRDHHRRGADIRYRGARRVCLPGQLHILHPDETHDGAAATGTGFGYRIVYLAPELIRDALAGRALPFVADPVQGLTPATQNMAGLVADVDESVSDLGRAEIAVTIADTLSGRPGDDRAVIDVRAAGLAREFLAAHAREQTPASVLEQVTGTDRFTLARHFRQAFGTSPDRYRTRRRLGPGGDRKRNPARASRR